MTTTQRATVGESTAQHLIRLSDTLGQLGIELPESIEEANATAKQQLARIKDYRATAEPNALMREVEAKIANGTAELTDIFAAANARSITKNDPNSPMNNMFNNAQRIVTRTIHRKYSAHGDSWVTETLRPRVDHLVEQVLSHVPPMLDADPRRKPNELDVMLYIPEVVTAWGELHSIYKVFHDLRAYGIISNTYRRDDYYQFAGNPTAREGMQTNSITWFVWANQNNQKPGLYTESDITAPAN